MPLQTTNRSLRLVTSTALVAALVLVATLSYASSGAPADAASETGELVWTITLDPEEPVVGDTVIVSASACCYGSSPLLFAGLEVNQGGPAPILGEPALVGPYAVWEVPAVGAGTAVLRISGTFEKWICPTPGEFSQDCYSTLRYVTSPDVTVVVAGMALRGDANCDERVSSVDAALILQYLARLITSLACPDVADVDGDGTAGSRDALLILQYEAGLIDAL